MRFNPADKLIVALDGMNKAEALSFSSKIPGLIWVKVGLELFVSSGPELIFDLKQMGKRVFLDLKFHDIPATMAAACQRAASTGVELITVHACAGFKALTDCQEASFEAACEAGLKPPTLLAVTVLTSWDPNRLANEIFIDQPLKERVEKLAELAKEAGLGGCVCSPKEVKNLRGKHPLPFELITPGIRPKGFSSDDQMRVMSPSETITLGASRLVIGRPITRDKDPAGVFLRCCEEIEDSHSD